MPRKDAAKELRELQAEVQQRLSQVSLLQQEQRELKMQHDALVAFVDLLGWLRDHHTQHIARTEPEQQGQQQQPSLAALLGNSSELLLLDQLRYLPYNGGVHHARAHTSSSSAAAAQHTGHGLHSDEDDDAEASHFEQRIAPQGDLMYWLRWMLAKPLHPQAHTITVEELTTMYAQTLREMSLLLHQLNYGTGYDHPPCSNNADSAAAAAEEEEADSADIPKDPFERLGQHVLQHNHLMVSEILAGRNHVLAAFSLADPETRKARTEHDLERYKWAVQQIKLKPEQVSDIVGVMQVSHRIYTPVAMQLRKLQLELGLQPVGVSNGAFHISAGGGGTSGSGSSSATANTSSSNGTGSSSGCTESEVQPPSSMLQHLTESDAHAQKLRRLDLLLKKDAMIKTGIGMLLGGALELPQLARLMVLMSYPLNYATFGITVVDMHKQQMLEQGQQQQQGQQKQARCQQQPMVLSKKRMSLLRRKLEVCNISKI